MKSNQVTFQDAIGQNVTIRESEKENQISLIVDMNGNLMNLSIATMTNGLKTRLRSFLNTNKRKSTLNFQDRDYNECYLKPTATDDIKFGTKDFELVLSKSIATSLLSLMDDFTSKGFITNLA